MHFCISVPPAVASNSSHVPDCFYPQSSGASPHSLCHSSLFHVSDLCPCFFMRRLSLRIVWFFGSLDGSWTLSFFLLLIYIFVPDLPLLCLETLGFWTSRRVWSLHVRLLLLSLTLLLLHVPVVIYQDSWAEWQRILLSLFCERKSFSPNWWH